MTRNFHIGDILTITTGVLVAPRHMEAVYDILGFMTHDKPFTHQLPRFCEECAPELLRQHPQLKAVEVPSFDGCLDADRQRVVGEWLAEQVLLFGETLPVTPIAGDDHTRIGPVVELASMVGPERIVVI